MKPFLFLVNGLVNSLLLTVQPCRVFFELEIIEFKKHSFLKLQNCSVLGSLLPSFVPPCGIKVRLQGANYRIHIFTEIFLA